ncbi:Bug family tripartite tricarboxylate transporter substrate binding protein [Bordetella sp. 2513F-2]
MKKNRFLAMLGALAASVLLNTAAAAEYPSRPITLVIGFGAGGPTDVVGRYMAQQLGDKLGQAVVVENRPGANGLIALQYVQRAKPDGYTLLLASSGSLAIEPAYRKSISYDVFKDFTIVSPVAQYPYVMVVDAKSDIQSIPDLVKRGQAAKEPMTFGSAGMGADNHLAGEWFAKQMNVPLLHVPYSGGDSAMINGMLTGGVDMALISAAVALPQVQGGKLRAIGIGTAQRAEFLPDVPTVIEATNQADFIIGPWNGIIGPAGMDAAVVQKLNTAVQEVLSGEETRKKLLSYGQYPFRGSGDDFGRHIRAQQQHWSKVIAAAGIEKLD